MLQASMVNAVAAMGEELEEAGVTTEGVFR